jgi:hypothetical protein
MEALIKLQYHFGVKNLLCVGANKNKLKNKVLVPNLSFRFFKSIF